MKPLTMPRIGKRPEPYKQHPQHRSPHTSPAGKGTGSTGVRGLAFSGNGSQESEILQAGAGAHEHQVQAPVAEVAVRG